MLKSYRLPLQADVIQNKFITGSESLDASAFFTNFTNCNLIEIYETRKVRFDIFWDKFLPSSSEIVRSFYRLPRALIHI